jgi:hypothetical protein
VHDPFGADGGAFDPAMVDIMSQALDGAYAAVEADAKAANGGDAAVRSALAKLIIELAKDGERDPAQLTHLTVERFRQARAS